MRRKEVFGCLKLSRVSGRQPDWQEFIFLRNRKRLLPKNAILTYMPSKLIEDGETSRPLHTSPGFVNGLKDPSPQGAASMSLIFVGRLVDDYPAFPLHSEIAEYKEHRNRRAP